MEILEELNLSSNTLQSLPDSIGLLPRDSDGRQILPPQPQPRGTLLDAQVSNPHLLGLGARELPRDAFLAQVRTLAAQPCDPLRWRKVAPRRAADFL